MMAPAQIPNPYVKPRWQAPVGVMESVVAYNCRKYGFPRPVLAMPFWEGAGDRAIDLSGHGNNGTLTNNPSWTADGLDFVHASNQYINTGLTIPGNVFTVAINVNATTVSATYNDYCGWSDDAANFFVFEAVDKTSTKSIVGKIGGVVDFNAGTSPFTASAQSGFWIATLDGTNAITYTNGVQSSTTGHDKDFSTISSTFGIGWGGTGRGTARCISTVIGEVYVFDVALSAAQVKFLYDNPYFMYRLPEELYGYTTGAPPAVSIPVFMHHYHQLRGA